MSTPFDLCVITAANEQQARGYESQLEWRRKKGLLPDTEFKIIADPNGQRIGPGGSTFYALDLLYQEYGDTEGEYKNLWSDTAITVDGETHSYSFVKDGSTVTIYEDGNVIGQSTSMYATMRSGADTEIGFGAETTGEWGMDGEIVNIQISHGNDAQLSYDFEGDNPFTDKSGNGHDATVHADANVVQSIVFTPDANYNGDASFEYTISDGNGGTSTATTTLSVGSVNDVLDYTDDHDLDGGYGFDTLDITGEDSIDISHIAPKVHNIEVIDMDDGLSQTLNIKLGDIVDMTDDDNDLVFVGNDGDVINFEDSQEWTKSDNTTKVDGVDGNFNQYVSNSNSNISVFIEDDIHVDSDF